MTYPAVLEIVPRISFRFREQAAFDHIEDDIAEIPAVVDAPFLQHGQSHRPVLLERELPHAVEQFLAADMADLAQVFLADELLGKTQSLAHERIGVAMETRVLRKDLLHNFIKIDF